MEHTKRSDGKIMKRWIFEKVKILIYYQFIKKFKFNLQFDSKIKNSLFAQILSDLPFTKSTNDRNQIINLL